MKIMQTMGKQELMRQLSQIDRQNGMLPPDLMPKTRDASVKLWGCLPMPYYNSLRPKSLDDVFRSPTCSMAVVKKEFGEQHLRALTVHILNDLINFFNVGKTMGAIQVAQTADLIIEEYYYLKPDDFKLCFNRAKKGYYGKLYDRIDGQVIIDWLSKYDAERTELARVDSEQNAVYWDLEGTERTSERKSSEYQAYLKSYYQGKFNSKQ